MSEQLWNYLRHGKQQVKGWLQRIDAEIMGSILEFQREQEISGGCVEIGVHHGKSFIPLCMALQDEEKALCIDLFDDQARNLDASGRGDLGRFQESLAKFNIDSSRVAIFEGSSEDATDEYIRQQVGPVRYFSVDGGHWKSIVLNDLELAERSLARDGVIALDDYCRAEWPEVTEAYSIWRQQTESDIIPFACGSNKLFLCRKQFATNYQSAIRTPFMRHFLSKRYHSGDHEVHCYRVELVEQDETLMDDALALMMKIFRPDMYVDLRNGARQNRTKRQT